MKVISCDTMREGVIVSFAFLIIGSGLVFVAANLIPQVAYLPLVANVLGIICILFAPFILISTFIFTVMPSSKKKMEDCEH